MSIRAKILIGCLSLVLLTLATGVQSQVAQVRLGRIALGLYDDAFMSMSYLRAAQNTLVAISRDLSLGATIPDMTTRLESAAGDLEVAHARAMSPEGARIAAGLRVRILGIGHAISVTNPQYSGLDGLAAAIDDAVEVFAGDGYRARSAAVAVAVQTSRTTLAAICASLAVALAITALLTRAIVPSLRDAVRIATSIASGRLDNHIVIPGAARGRSETGRSETGRLLHALGVMQDSIAEKIHRIEGLMADQASSHAVEIAEQTDRFEAALDNMSQGLCMFDAAGRLLVWNRRFGEMFGTPRNGAEDHQVLPAVLLHADPSTPVRTLADRRAIAVTRQAMHDGGWVGTFEDVTERQRIEERLAHMARHDALTGLPNRLLYREYMEQALAQARRGGSGLAVLCVDLDGFKGANDALGHAVGDMLLRATAQRLLEATRESDIVVRLGGDEFAIVQTAAAQPTDAKALAERIVEALAQPFDVGGQQMTLGGSIGIALTGDGLTTPDGMLKGANLALQRAKADRGTYRFFEAEMDARMRARRALEQDLRQAVMDDAFEVYYQPLVETLTGSVSGFEGLVRWRHATRGMVSPAEFIPLAEEVGLISAIGASVLNRACHDAARWPSHVKVAVNLSPLQFRNRWLARDVAAALSRSGLQPGRLELEITESLLLKESEATLAILHELRGIGVRISMDDFGTGYSSLSYLRRFPFDKIKIDQSFVRNLAEDGDCLAIVRAVVGLGASLGMRVTAEGVETETQYELLRREGCHQVQGYLFSRPMPCSEVPGLIDRFAEAA